MLSYNLFINLQLENTITADAEKWLWNTCLKLTYMLQSRVLTVEPSRVLLGISNTFYRILGCGFFCKLR